MKFYSTRDSNYWVNAQQAIVENLCPKGGLFMPESIKLCPELKNSKNLSLAEIGFYVAKNFLSESFNLEQLQSICTKAFNFEAPLVQLSSDISILELTHGPSLAFKDFGARFMSECLALIAERNSIEYKVLTATSGDTGGAVAAALYNKPGVSVSILYPKGRISPFQEGQMTKWGGNISTIAVEGSFDDCQRLVKAAFSRADFSKSRNLVSANSINISRLLAQMVYYIYALKEHPDNNALTFVVPSGNLGNLTAGVWAARFYGSNCRFHAAHNLNSTFPDYLNSGHYSPKDSILSISNAMDVGAPSNFERLSSFFEADISKIKEVISASTVSDADTLSEIRSTYQQFSYIACPHTAVALHAAKNLPGNKVVLATADPSKFSEVLLAANLSCPQSDNQNKPAPASYVILPELSELLKII